MKKIILSVFAAFAFVAVNAQDINAGLSLGLPIGDAGDSYTFNITLDANYLWEVSDKFDAGIATGLSYNFGDEIDITGPVNPLPGVPSSIEIDDAVFLPIAGAARYAVSDKFTVGADLGYAVGLSPSGNDGGFYYAPKLQYGVSDALDIVFAYRGISVDGGSFDNLTLGVEFGF